MYRRSRTIMVVATFAVVAGVGFAHATLIGHYRFLSGSRLGWNLAYGALMSLAAYAAGLPDKTAGRAAALVQAGSAVVAAAVGASIIELVVGSLILPRFVVAVSTVALIPAYIGCASMSLRERAGRQRRERILILAESDVVATFVGDLLNGSEHPALVVASPRPAQVRGRGTESQPLVELAEHCRPTVLVLDRMATADDSLVSQAAVLHERGIRVRTLSAFYEEWMGKLPISELERVSLMFDIGELHRARYGRIKRAADVGIALVGVVITILIVPMIALVNLASNRGPLLFRQERVGKGGKVFTIVKFRTCHELDGRTSWILDDDPRVTSGGFWLRRLHIDEWPNFLNILRGDMTLVGPRPEQPSYVEELSGKLPFYGVRHLVRPGLTGWAQVNYGYASDHVGALQKLQYDFYYLRYQSLRMDLRVVARTVRAMFTAR